MQIRDGLHVFGRVPADAQRNDLIVSIARLPRSDLKAQDASLHRALALDLGLGEFDPLTRDLAADFDGPRPAILASASTAAWRTAGDTVERIEWLALQLVAGVQPCDGGWSRTREVLDWIDAKLRPVIDACGAAEISAFLRGLDGRFVRPGPVRRADAGTDRMCCPRGAISLQSTCGPCRRRRLGGSGNWRRNAWSKRYWQEAGEWPRAIALSAWGTANMRTGGDDVAQALALIGARPLWEETSGRVTGFAITPLERIEAPAGGRYLSRVRTFPRRLSDADGLSSEAPSTPSPCSMSRTKPIRSPRTFASGGRRSRPAGWTARPRNAGPHIACSARSPAPMARACRR